MGQGRRFDRARGIYSSARRSWGEEILKEDPVGFGKAPGAQAKENGDRVAAVGQARKPWRSQHSDRMHERRKEDEPGAECPAQAAEGLFLLDLEHFAHQP